MPLVATEVHGQDGDCSLEELLAAHLANAEQTLEMQHQRTLRAVARHLKVEAEKHLERLSYENETLRARLSEFPDSGDVAAGSAASKVASDRSQILRIAAGSAENILTAVDSGGPVRPDSRERRASPDPPSTAPRRLPGELADVNEDEDDDDEDAGMVVSNIFNSKSSVARVKSEGILRKGQGGGLKEKSAFVKRSFQLLDVWTAQKQHGGMESSVYTTVTTLRSWNTRMSGFTDAGGEAETDTYYDGGCCRHFIVHPYNPWRSIWDITSLLLVLYDMIMLPMGFFDLPEDDIFLVVMVWTTRIFWTLDMPLSFMSGFVTAHGTIELRPRRIAIRYFRSWFLLDLLVVGVDWLDLVLSATAESLGIARLGKGSRVFRILRMVRLLRLARMTQVINLLTERLNNDRLVIVIDLGKLMIIMISAGHLLACIWYAIGQASHDKGGDSWLVAYEFKDRDLDMRYVMSLRWAISQFAGGMDEVTPESLGENVYAIFVYLSAFWSGAVFLSILTSSMTQWYIVGSEHTRQLTVLRRYLSQNGISKKLAVRVQRNAQHAVAEQQKAMPEAAVGLILKVSEPLKIELHFEMYSPSLLVHPFFHNYIEECPHVMRKVCHSAMSTNTISAGDTIFHGGEIPSAPKMYIVSRGSLTYTSALTALKTPVTAGNWVSEPTLWVQWVHRGTLLAYEDCLLFTLLAGEFQSIVSRFQHVGFDPRSYATIFVDCLNEYDGDVNDLELPELHAKVDRVTQTRLTSFGNAAKRGMTGRRTFFPSFKRGSRGKTLSVFSRATSVDKIQERASRQSRPSDPWAQVDSMPSSTTVGEVGEAQDTKGQSSVGAVLAYAKSDYNDNESEDSIVCAKDAEAIGVEPPESSVRGILAKTSRQYQKGGKKYSSGELRRTSSGQLWKPTTSKLKHGVSFAVDESGSPANRRFRVQKPPSLHSLRSDPSSDLPELNSKAFPIRNQQTTWCDEQEV